MDDLAKDRSRWWIGCSEGKLDGNFFDFYACKATGGCKKESARDNDCRKGAGGGARKGQPADGLGAGGGANNHCHACKGGDYCELDHGCAKCCDDLGGASEGGCTTKFTINSSVVVKGAEGGSTGGHDLSR